MSVHFHPFLYVTLALPHGYSYPTAFCNCFLPSSPCFVITFKSHFSLHARVCIVIMSRRGVGAVPMAARLCNPEVAGSNPVPATRKTRYLNEVAECRFHLP